MQFFLSHLKRLKLSAQVNIDHFQCLLSLLCIFGNALKLFIFNDFPYIKEKVRTQQIWSSLFGEKLYLIVWNIRSHFQSVQRNKTVQTNEESCLQRWLSK